MTSQASVAFKKNCTDVDRLLEIHSEITGDEPGRRWQQVESLHKAAFVLITAFWEAFCEDLAAEALDHLVNQAQGANSLPLDLQKLVAKELKATGQHELAIWQLAGDGWRTVLSTRLQRLQQERNRKLNTPKTAQIDDLFTNAVGVGGVSKSWFWKGMTAARASEKLDEFVTLRGEVAHRGSAADSIRKTQVKNYYNHIVKLVGKTEARVARAVADAIGSAPWS